MNPSEHQILFKRNMHWGGTVSGAFQHSGLYKKDSLNYENSKLRKSFREELRKKLESLESEYNSSVITTQEHITQIKKLQSWSEQYKEILNGERLNFGITQKLLNLHLKGLWCFGLLKYPPPNFPVDRIIQERLNIRPVFAWTDMEDENAYLKIIDAAKNIASEHNISIAELELQVYNGTLKIIK